MRRGLLVVLSVALVAVLAGPALAYKASISRTSFGIPHVRAGDWGGLGFGAGYAYAEDNLCTLADEVVTVRAQRSRYFGPDGVSVASAKGSEQNIDSDFFWQQIERPPSRRRSWLPSRPPLGPKPAGARDGPRLGGRLQRLPAQAGRRNGSPTRAAAARPGCGRSPRSTSGAATTSSGCSPAAACSSATSSRPSRPGPRPRARQARRAARGAPTLVALAAASSPIGSNAVGLGSEATESGRGMLLGQPALPLDRRRALLPVPAHPAGEDRSAGSQPARHPGREHRLQRSRRLVAHGLHGVALHAVPAAARGR